MSLARLAVIRLSPAPKAGNHFDGQIGQTTLTTLGANPDGQDLDIFMCAETPLKHPPKVTSAKEVVVPELPRRQLEAALEMFANMISVFEGVRRTISSPAPCVAFGSTDPEGIRWLAQHAGINSQEHLIEQPFFHTRPPLGDPMILAGLGDRDDGVALLAEVYSQAHALGQLRDTFRLFERAFRLPPRKLPGPLAAFLDDRFGYEEAEIKDWLKVRDPATHADVRRKFALEPDARPYLGRMQIAAEDVLLNKETWRDPDTARRDLWPLRAWTTGPMPEAKMTAVLHATVTIGAQFLDPFGTFPWAFSHLRGHALPKHLWAPVVTTVQSPERPFEVLPLDHPDAHIRAAGDGG